MPQVQPLGRAGKSLSRQHLAHDGYCFDMKRRPVIYTVGHSTRSLEEFVPLLWAHGVARLVDVRSIPRSRHNPQFNRDQLHRLLRRAGIG